jgi:uncharacterized protein DUF4251
MNSLNKTIANIFFVGLLLSAAHALNAQPDKSVVKTSVESKQFVFHAQTALPTSGRSRQLTSEYGLTVLSDSLVSNLPFYGRAYSVPYGSGDGGFNFTSTKFEYTASPGKKKGWNISIKPKDVTDLREFTLSLSDNGYGTLQVLSNNRQPISFTGYITEIK